MSGLPDAAAWLPALDLHLLAAARALVLDWPAQALLAVAGLSHLGDRWVIGGLIAAASAWLMWRGQWPRALALALLMAGQGLAVWALKDLALRPRPALGPVLADWVVVRGSSLPSGHAAAALVGYGLLAWVLLRGLAPPPARPADALADTRADALADALADAVAVARPAAAVAPLRPAWVLLPAAALALGVGISRVLLGVHYPSDVLAAWALGALWLALAVPLLERLPAWRQPR
ncbi:phosphatase PAP2 family protein [Aquabacterium sp. OR-4]|uniref:phosphatase PAP2 family protein n=1 Tax=Aquabacterium sp. OR-4 TaxID=2978127 RepID=UPI0021B38C8E|nr:phosphatase PAP2 family protein [Aquabacterium sp. OR-4]MDT7835057.1 phosphatase PAP2 family protein [Aquabacterium sp. OR-4]